MKRKSLAKYLSLTLAVLLFITVIPQNKALVYANEKIDISATEIPTTEKSATKSLQEIALQKAKTLTTLYGVSSISYALIDNGTIVLSENYISKNITNETSDYDMYGIGSISKVFTATAIMQLTEQGKLSLDNSVVSYLPEFTMADERYKDITVRMLINHSSGLMGSTLSNAMLFGDKDTTAHDKFLSNLKTQHLKADPGTFSVYCNDGFTLAEILIEKITGISFTQYLRNNIITPMALIKTATPAEDLTAQLLAGSYSKLFPLTLPSDALQAIGAGGIYSSAEDLCHFAELFMVSGSYKNVLSSYYTDAMEYPEYSRGLWPSQGDSFSYGLGWDSVSAYPYETYGIKALSKGGDTNTYHGNLTVLPEENMAIAVLSSGGSSSYNGVIAQEILLEALKAKGRISNINPPISYQPPKKIPIPDTQMEFEGVYGNTGNMLKASMKNDGTLTLTSLLSSASPAQIFYYTGDGKYYYTDGSYYLTFEKQSDGNVYIYHSGYVKLPGLGQSETSGYLFQKLSDNVITPETEKIWQSRSGKTYFLISEKYSSQLYALSAPYTELKMTKDIKGYWINSAIIDNSRAVASFQIPGMYSRDLSEYTFYQEGATEYLTVNGSTYLSSDNITNLSAGNKKYTIGAKGYASWYAIEQKNASTKVSITVPEKAAYAVYDSNNTCLAYSYVQKKSTITLPQKGYLVFIGDPGAAFQVKYLK